VVGGRARVERDRLAFTDQRGCAARARAVALDLEPQPQIARDLGLAVAERPPAASNAGDQPLARERRQVAAPRPRRDRRTRRHVYPWPGAARTVHERIADAALVNRRTGCCPSVALHIPWDAVDDYAALRRDAEELGIRIGAINPNLFGSDEYRLGSLCHPD